MVLKVGPASLAAMVFASCMHLAVHAQTLGREYDKMPYDSLLFAGTHNSAINLGSGTVGKPSDAQLGRYPSEAHSAYQYIVMDQRLSVRDQLEGGVRVLDFEVAKVKGSEWECSSKEKAATNSCNEHWTIKGRCFSDCPFIVSHGSLQQSIGDLLGYTFPEALFQSVREFVDERPLEVVTVLLIATHGNSAPDSADVVDRMNSTGLLKHVWNDDPTEPFTAFPTVGEMRDAGKTVLVSSSWGWGPGMRSSMVNSTGIKGAYAKCGPSGETPCMEGWDAVSFFQQAPERAVLSYPPPPANDTKLFAIENLSSRRGRDDHSYSYSRLPNELTDFPFQAGGNPAQGGLAADRDHVLALESAWKKKLSESGIRRNGANWVSLSCVRGGA